MIMAIACSATTGPWTRPALQMTTLLAMSSGDMNRSTAAVDRFMSPELIASNVVICNAGRVHGPVVAEHAIAMIMALAKRVPSAVRYQERRKWARDAMWNERPRPREV